jgi:hypothetical protein
MPETPAPTETPRCTECGAAAPAAPPAAEPVTHCEWCGAEYPVPEQK